MLKTLLITPDLQLVASLEPSLQRLEFETDVKTTIPDGIDKMRYQRYCALLVDCTAGSLQQVDASRNLWLNHDSTVIAIAGNGSATYDGIEGADAVWTQPLRPWEVHRTLLNIRAQATGDRRLRTRYVPTRPASLRYSYDGQGFHDASIVDVTETGVAIEGLEMVPDGTLVQVQFKLPAMLGAIHAVATVVWRNGRRAGLHFVQMEVEEQRRLERWLRQARLGMSTGNMTYSYAAGY